MKTLLAGAKYCLLGLALAALIIPAVGQETSKPMAPDPQTQQSQPSDQSAGAPVSSQSIKTFHGTITQSSGTFVLKEATGASYQLDDQDAAKNFNGQKVTVTGTLDSSAHSIRVASISPAS